MDWAKLISSAVFGAASAIVTVTLWVSDKTHQLEAQELSIQRLQVTNNILSDQLDAINQRLSSIEGKIDVILNQKYH